AVKRARAMLVDELGLDPGRDLVELERLLLRQDPSLAAPVGRVVSTECPYRGLLAYGPDDADTFFGRDRDAAACLRRLRDTGVLTVVGPSGVGKSSLVRAGVVASLLRGRTSVLVTTPGVHPMESLRGLRPLGGQVLVVDQAEEAVTVCADVAEREQYFAALAAHANAGGGLVLTLRADHLGDLAPYADIARVLEEGMYLLGPMDEVDLRSAIEGPARRAGLHLEPGLVDLLVRDVEGEPASLPLLSHVLRATWERREGPTLTVAGYRATGGIRSAVAQSAESLYDGLDPATRTRLRGLLLRLVVPAEAGHPVRAKAPVSKIVTDDVLARLVEMLVDARLVSIDGDSIQVAHEALVRVWPRLRGWLDDDVDGQRLFRHLAGAAEAWNAMGRPDSELYRGARLGRALEWRDRAAPDLDATETVFLEASATLSESELRAAEQRVLRERRVNRRLRGALAGVAVFLVLALVAGLAAVRTADRAQRDQQRAERAAALADVRRTGVQALTHEFAATSLLLGVTALRFDPSPEARTNLVSTLSRLGSLQRIQQTGDLAVSVAASGDGSVVAASMPVDGVKLFDAKTLAPIRFDDKTPTSVVAFSPEGSVMAAAVNQWTPEGSAPRISSQPVHLYDMKTRRLADAQLGGWPDGANVEYAMTFSRDGRRIAAGVQSFNSRTRSWEHTGAVMVWDVAHPATPTFSVPLPELAQVALSPDGRHLYVGTTGPRPLREYDVDSGRLLRRTGVPGLPQAGIKGAIEISPDGATLALVTGGRIDLYDTSTLKPRSPALHGHTGEVTDLDFSHDGTKLLSASTDRTSIVWDVATGTELRRLAAQNDQSWGAAFGADDRTVYTGSGDGTLMSWDVTGEHGLLV
ncbi:MAG: hypothetical protein QOE05_423, partial [Actinomycetota bacterium]|nr:hypothetical protein [Actinomycetota bacterium]